jgi:hypothetical protein
MAQVVEPHPRQVLHSGHHVVEIVSEAVRQSRFPVLATAHQGIAGLANTDLQQRLCLFPLQAAQLFDREAGNVVDVPTGPRYAVASRNLNVS